MTNLKVYGGMSMINGKQVRTIVAAPSQAQASRLVGLPPKYLADFWCITGNQKELNVALSSPGIVFREVGRYSGKYEQETACVPK